MSDLILSPPDAANNDWKQEHPKYAGRVFARLIEADQRLSAIKERTRINRSEEKPIHPLQALDFDPDRERDTSNTFNALNPAAAQDSSSLLERAKREGFAGDSIRRGSSSSRKDRFVHFRFAVATDLSPTKGLCSASPQTALQQHPWFH
jgi:hypothetical protein